MHLSRTVLVAVTMAVGLLHSAAIAQDSTVSAGSFRTPFDASADRFSSGLDTLGERMADSYHRRQLATAHQHQMASESELPYILGAQAFHQRTIDQMLASKNPLDQSAYNQGNNQANNGFMPGNILASPGGQNGWGPFGDGLWNAGLFPGQFGSLPFPGTFGTVPRSPFAVRPNAANRTSTFTTNGTFGFNGTGTQTSTGTNTGGTGTGSGSAIGTSNTTGSTNTVRSNTTTISGQRFPL